VRERAISERAAAGVDRIASVTVCVTPKRYVTGQETALVNYLNTGRAVRTRGPLPFERGVRPQPDAERPDARAPGAGRPPRRALVQAARDARRSGLGTDHDRGAVTAHGVDEIEQGIGLNEMLDLTGVERRLSGVLLGRYFGSWVRREQTPRLLLARGELAPYRGVRGG